MGTKSNLATYISISPNSNNPRNQKIDKLTIHHMAGNLTLEQFGDIVSKPARQMSANYAIESSGRCGIYVYEENRSWCSSNAANDHRAITIEVANDGGAPNWHVSDAAFEMLLNVCTDICNKYGFKLVYTGDASGTLTTHDMFSNTQCPGPYLKSKMNYIAEEVNKRLQTTGGTTMAMSTRPIRMNIGDIKGTDCTKLENTFNSLGITWKKQGDRYITDQAISKTDQVSILTLVENLGGIGYEPYFEAVQSGVNQEEYNKLAAERDALQGKVDKAQEALK